jgi:hypothetical protein
MLEARIELLRSGGLTDIQSLCAHVNRNKDLATGSRNIAGGQRACHDGGSKDKPGTHDSCFGVHMNLLEDVR